jgi:hypothetical protein
LPDCPGFANWVLRHVDERSDLLSTRERGPTAESAVSERSGYTAIGTVCNVAAATGLIIVGDLIGEGAAQERGIVGENTLDMPFVNGAPSCHVRP